ncbi:MAG: hypothetical protein NVSMB48_24140 [Marmoricola sp.]
MAPDIARRARIGAVAALAVVGATTLAACGGKPYVPLTAANLGPVLTAAGAKAHTAHEVSTGNGVRTVIDFDTSSLFAYRLTQTRTGAPAKTLIGIGADRYLQDPGVTPAGKWLKLSTSSPTPVITFADVNPVAMVVRFAKSISKFAYVGATTIDGTRVQHYRITIDQQKFLQATGQSQSTTNIGAGELIAENLYLNSDNTVRRVTLALPGGVGDTQVDVTGWGSPVTIQPPPSSAVVTSVSSTK